MAETKAASGGEVFDIAKPGTSAPSSSAKPIIVTNRPVLQDPMVVSDSNKTEEPATPIASPSKQKKIEPLHAVADNKAAAKTEAQPPAAAEPSASEVLASTPKPDSGPSTEIIESQSTGTDGGKKKLETDEALQKKAAERAAELEKLADSRQYYLPINQVEKRRSKRYAMLGACLILLLGLAWTDVALDAGLITIPGVQAPTHFFK